MQANDVILPLRARLRDDNFADLRFSDSEICDYLSLVENEIISDFWCNIQNFTIPKGARELVLPKIALGFVCAKCGGSEIPLITYESFIAKGAQTLSLFAKDFRTYCLTHAAGAEVEVFVNLSNGIKDPSDSLVIDEAFLNLAILGVLKNILLTETNQNNLQKIELYNNLYEKEKGVLLRIKNRQKEKSHFKTPFILV